MTSQPFFSFPRSYPSKLIKTLLPPLTQGFLHRDLWRGLIKKPFSLQITPSFPSARSLPGKFIREPLSWTKNYVDRDHLKTSLSRLNWSNLQSLLNWPDHCAAEQIAQGCFHNWRIYHFLILCWKLFDFNTNNVSRYRSYGSPNTWGNFRWLIA